MSLFSQSVANKSRITVGRSVKIGVFIVEDEIPISAEYSQQKIGHKAFDLPCDIAIRKVTDPVTLYRTLKITMPLEDDKF